MTTKIITDSSANIKTPEILGVDHVNVPLMLQIDGQTWFDDDKINMEEFKAALKKTTNKSTSACPNINDWLTAFEGGDEIFVITLTSALSGSYNAAKQAAKIYHQDHPQAKILVFDSRSAGPQLKLLAERVAQLVKKGFTFEEVVKEAEAYQHHIELLFILKDLHNLSNNGRVSPAVAKVAGLLKISVVGEANKKGEFELVGKARGDKKGQLKLISKMIKDGYIGGRVIIDHVNNLSGAEDLKALILKKFPEADIHIEECSALCSYYAEEGGLMIGFEN